MYAKNQHESSSLEYYKLIYEMMKKKKNFKNRIILETILLSFSECGAIKQQKQISKETDIEIISILKIILDKSESIFISYANKNLKRFNLLLKYLRDLIPLFMSSQNINDCLSVLNSLFKLYQFIFKNRKNDRKKQLSNLD